MMTDAAKRAKEKADAVVKSQRADHKNIKAMDVADFQIGEKRSVGSGNEK